MRLRKDATSYKAAGLKARLQPIPDKPKYHAKKDTKHWCKGVVGREHDYEYQYPRNDTWQSNLVAVCFKCSKQDYTQTLWWCQKHEDFEAEFYWSDKHD